LAEEIIKTNIPFPIEIIEGLKYVPICEVLVNELTFKEVSSQIEIARYKNKLESYIVKNIMHPLSKVKY